MASVVFLPGCNFRCPYCHNHPLVLRPQEHGTWPLAEVLDRMDRLQGWVDGVCVTGGEPTGHRGLPLLLGTFKGRGWAVKLDTNGSDPGALRSLLRAELVDAVAVDVKAPLEPIPYRRNAGASADPEAVRQTLELLAATPLPLEARTTVHPALLSRQELCRLAGQVGRILGRRGGAAARWTAQRCHTADPLDPALRERGAQDPETFEQWAAEAQAAFREGLAAGSGTG
ncbi:MAG: anaerobic ribonucleoside-triphosphate reductase activating protein [Deferrisomatales bacterium]